MVEKKDSNKNILVICAHSDDQVLGPGGTVAKFARDGYNVFTIIFSYGELSHPHMKKKYITKIRVQESKEADKIIGGKGVIFLGLKDGSIKDDFIKRNMRKKLLSLFYEYSPKIIFTHSEDDLLPDHRFVKEVVLSIYDELYKQKKLVSDVYSFDIWNIWNLLKRNKPKLVVDVSSTFKYKIRALQEFKSQFSLFSHTVFLYILVISVFVKAYLHGFIYKFKKAEVFYKLR